MILASGIAFLVSGRESPLKCNGNMERTAIQALPNYLFISKLIGLVGETFAKLKDLWMLL